MQVYWPEDAGEQSTVFCAALPAAPTAIATLEKSAVEYPSFHCTADTCAPDVVSDSGRLTVPLGETEPVPTESTAAKLHCSNSNGKERRTSR